MKKNAAHGGLVPGLSLAGIIVTLGIVYGDIGTSPLYVMKAILNSTNDVTPKFILGALSCIIWTLTLQTTIKYILITLRADNKGEGGIFSLFALIRKRASWAYMIAIIGGCTLLADGIITPSITVTSAIEGLNTYNPNIPVIPVVLAIIVFLFVIQQFGTNFLGKSFGPVMFIWFSFLGVLGLINLFSFPMVLQSFNPYYAWDLLTHNPSGILLLGAVFLCTTGAEALYSDLGHCGLKNIRISWIFVKSTLILNYLGQGAWILSNVSSLKPNINPFFAIMPQEIIFFGVIISTLAAIIASQALISGSYTIISEAISLNFWPKIKINHPTTIKGQMYIPSINWFLFTCCVLVIIYFRESSKMEAAYGLSITITMLMTTMLLSVYLRQQKIPIYIIGVFLAIYASIEGVFLYSNMNKFMHGGWVTIVIAGLLLAIMYFWYNGRKIKDSFYDYIKIEPYLPVIEDLSKDKDIPKYATNLVYVTRAKRAKDLESKIIYSLLHKQPKRADVYWFLHVRTCDDPYKMEYDVVELVPNVVYRVYFNLGFKVQPRINLYFRQVVEELVNQEKYDVLSRYKSLRDHKVLADFRFVIIDRIQNYDFDFPAFKQFVMNFYYILKRIGISDVKALGLDSSMVTIEEVPLIQDQKHKKKLIKGDYEEMLRRT